MLHDEDLTREIIGSAIEVHKVLGPGLLESAYEVCLCHELHLRGISFQSQLPLPVVYKGMRLETELRIDLMVEDCVLVELKCVEAMSPIFDAQLLTYLKLTGKRLGLLINFNVPLLKNGIKRIVH